MAIFSQFPRKNYIPVKTIKLSDYTFDNIQVLDLLSAEYNEIFEGTSLNYSEFLVSQSFEGRPDLIANKFYGSTDLWWLICIYNNVINPLFDIPVGKRMRIPRRDELEFLLQSNKQRIENPRVVDIP